MTYKYDVFISYRRREPVLSWVREHFAPLVEQWLPQALPQDPAIFRDELSIETGEAWPEKLRLGILHARLLVAVFSPDYFRSPWCLAEFESMRAREKRHGLRSAERPDGLVYAVRFSDGEHFPEAAQALQQKDLRRFNLSAPGFRLTQPYVDFEREMQIVVSEIAALLPRAPDWQADWPVVTPPAAPRAHAPLPRLA